MTQREIDDVDAKTIGRRVGGRKLDRTNHVAGLADALCVENLKNDELNTWRDALEFRVLHFEPANEAGDVRAVAVAVERSVPQAQLAVGEVVEGLDARTE